MTGGAAGEGRSAGRARRSYWQTGSEGSVSAKP
jgi:hypothetical protein